MHWALAVVALALLAFAAISGRIAGTPVTAAMVFSDTTRDRRAAAPRRPGNVRDAVRCGPDRDRVAADRRDAVGRDCDTVVRR